MWYACVNQSIVTGLQYPRFYPNVPFSPTLQYMSSEMAAMQSPPAYPSPGGPNMANYPVAMYPNSGRPYPLQQDKRELVKGRYMCLNINFGKGSSLATCCILLGYFILQSSFPQLKL